MSGLSSELPHERLRSCLRAARLLALFLIGICLGEGAVRIGGMAPPRRPTYVGSLLRTSADPALGLENEPGSEVVARFRDHSGRTVREVFHRVNSDGWRGPEIGRERVPDRLRIACVGDSLMFGLGVGEEETFPRALERTLAAALPVAGVEALNFGVVGYEALEKARQIETVVPAYRPDLVLMQVGLWEDTRGPRRLARLQAHNWITRWLRPDGEGWLADLREVSLVVDSVAASLFRRAFQDNWVKANPKAVAAEGRGWEDLRTGVLLARDHAEARGAAFLLVLYPRLDQLEGRLVSAALGLALDAFAREHGIDYLDLHATFEGQAPETLRVHPEDDHYSAEALELAAGAVAGHLLSRGLVPAALAR